MKHNAQQLEIINALGKNIMVAASAGAGKTTVLISRLMKRIQQDQVSVNQICAMTFTEKAATEMKKRLAASLNKAYEESPTPFLYSQLQQLETAQISTIHSFCLSVIKEFGYLIGFDPARTSNILSNNSLEHLKHLAIQEVFESYYKKDDPIFLEVSSWFSSRPLDVSSFQKAIMDIYNTSQIHLNSQIFLDDLLTPYHATSFEELPIIYQETYRHFMSIVVKSLISLIDTLENVYLSEVEKQDDKTYQQIVEMDQQLHNLLDVVTTGSLSEISQQAQLTFKCTIKTIRGEDTFNQARKNLFDSLKIFLDTFFYQDDLEIVSKEQRAHIQLMIDLTKAYGQHFETLKQKHTALDFNDIEHLAYQILCYKEASDTLKNRYEEILVDEFQDSNFFQEAIVNLISKGNNVFRVGDVKQSIYGFRHAKPDIMRAHLNNPDNEVYYLSNNFRSKENIVEFNNMVFKQVMNIEEFKDSYTAQDEVTVGLDSQKTQQVPVVLHLPENKQEVMEDEEVLTLQNAKLIALTIAKSIQQQHKSGKSYKDMCVLVRSHIRKVELKEAFETFDIPYYFDDREGFTHAYSVQDVLNGIRLCQDPSSDFYLSYFLLSNFGQLDENSLATLRLHSSSSLMSNLNELYPHLYQSLQELIKLFNKTSLSEFLNHLYSFNNYYHDHLPLVQKSNLDLLYQKVVDYEQTVHTGWTGFMEQIAFVEDNDKSSNAVAIDENEDVVKVLTIHQSKGLQFPIVYYFSSSKLNIQDSNASLIIDGDMGIAFYHHDDISKRKHLLRVIIEQKNQLSEIEESLRLLYVALTRAQEQLHIVDILPSQDLLEPVSSYSLLNKEGHTLSILRSLINPKLYSIESNTIDVLSTLKKETTFSPSFTLPSPTYFQPKETIPYKVTLDLSGTLSSSEKGTYLHQLLEHWPQHQFSDDYLEDKNLNQQAINQLLAFRDNSFTQHLHTQQFGYEIGYATREEVGIMDFISVSNKEVVLVDFKSDRVDSEQTLIDRYQSQIDRYSQVLTLQYPQHNVQTYIYSLVLEKYIHIKKTQN